MYPKTLTILAILFPATALATPSTPAVLGTWDGDAAGDRLGEALAVVDLTGDGVDDLLIGAPKVDDPRDNGAPGTEDEAGAVYLHAGPHAASGDPGAAVATFTGDAGARLGASVATGDFDGDGLLDLAVGAPRWPGDGSDRGAVYVWLQTAPSGFTGTYDVDDADLVVEGVTVGGVLGWSIAAADFDDDGLDDLLMGEPGMSFTLPGAVRLLYGDPAFTGTLAATAVDATFEGSGNEALGWVVAAGDLTLGSGSWLAVGAPGNDANGVDAGAVYSREVTWWSRLVGAAPVLTHLNSWVWGDAAGDRYGYAIGRGEEVSVPIQYTLIGAPGAGADDAGRVYFYGSGPPGSSGGVAASTYGLGHVWGVAAAERCGVAVGGAGDLSGDGVDDAWVGCRGGTSQAGRLYVLDGTSIGFGSTAITDKAQSVIDGPAPDADLGAAAVDLGDVDGDGYAELLVGVPLGTDAAGVATGTAWTLAGGP